MANTLAWIMGVALSAPTFAQDYLVLNAAQEGGAYDTAAKKLAKFHRAGKVMRFDAAKPRASLGHSGSARRAASPSFSRRTRSTSTS